MSGAGRAAKEGSLFAEVAEGVHAYGVASHRHAPEIEQLVSRAAGQPGDAQLHAAPDADEPRHPLQHLRPADRHGDRPTTCARRWRSATPASRSCACWTRASVPATRHVRGSNHCLIGVFADRVPGRAIILSVIDNLVKGASGQAIQNMNLICGLDETTGLTQQPLFP